MPDINDRPDNFYDGNRSDATGFVDDNEVEQSLRDFELAEETMTEDDVDSEPVDIEDLTHELGEDNG